MNVHDLSPHEFIYSSGKVFALRLRFNGKPPMTVEKGEGRNTVLHQKIDNWNLNVTTEYRFLKKGKFHCTQRTMRSALELVTFNVCFFFSRP